MTSAPVSITAADADGTGRVQEPSATAAVAPLRWWQSRGEGGQPDAAGAGLAEGSGAGAASNTIAAYAAQALRTELWLTPKPGLVDRRNSGAHGDMNFDTLSRSIAVLAAWFPVFAALGGMGHSCNPVELLPRLRQAGKSCEAEMLLATGGVNTHKGAVFSLGLLCAAAGRLTADGRAPTREGLCAEVARMCAGMVARELCRAQPAGTAGERAFQRHGLSGARGEAESGFATVRTIALPAYGQARQGGASRETALLQALLHLMAVNGDTNLSARGGAAGLDYVRARARQLLHRGGALARGGRESLRAFDADLIARNLSPGGSADLLAVTVFLARFGAAPGRGRDRVSGPI